ncbi:hypothetical protein C9374_005618 [Naegleria lovaniensis]|uniref:RGS domain-containing protein n=1 Tax=Naegleria lovaniensis TaxID=51637 RepID=A0AA88KNC2_NAELO|nr:uncharacterized protein C9374_005618 [Naegleria lovaniensis]KAG2382416.1 hypothetical protein C9374_005618 [Naegleria lovaniensis]
MTDQHNPLELSTSSAPAQVAIDNTTHHPHILEEQDTSPLADLLSQLNIYNWAEFSKTFTNSSRHNSTLTSASSNTNSVIHVNGHPPHQPPNGAADTNAQLTRTKASDQQQEAPQIATNTTLGSQNLYPSSSSSSSPHQQTMTINNPQQTLSPHQQQHHHPQNLNHHGTAPSSHSSSSHIHPMMIGSDSSSPLMMNLSALSQHYTLLVVIRRYIRHGGCGFCNRRGLELADWYKALLQLCIIPVILHAESEDEGNEFFHAYKNPIVAHIPRVSDPRYKRVSKLLEMASPQGATPLKFEELSFKTKLKTIRPYMTALKQGYTFVQKPNEVEFSEGTNLLVPKMVLIRDNEIKYVFDHELYDHTPDVLSTVILKLPWLAMTSADLWNSSSDACSNSTSFFRASISSAVSNLEVLNEMPNHLKTGTTTTTVSNFQGQQRKVSSGSTSQHSTPQQHGGHDTRKISSASNPLSLPNVHQDETMVMTTLSSSYQQQQHSRKLSSSSMSSSHQSQFLKQHLRNDSLLDPTTIPSPNLDAFDLTRRKISNGQLPLASSFNNTSSNLVSNPQDHVTNNGFPTQLPTSPTSSSRKQSSASAGKISPRQRHDLQYYLDQMSQKVSSNSQHDDKSFSTHSKSSYTPPHGGGGGGNHSRQHSQLSDLVLGTELGDPAAVSITVQDMNAFGVVQESVKTKLLTPEIMTTTTTDGELLIEGMESNQLQLAMHVAQTHQHSHDTSHSPSQRQQHVQPQNDHPVKHHASPFTLIRSVPIYRKVEGVLDFEHISKEQLAEEQHQAALEAKQRMKKRAFIACMRVEETIEDTESEVATIKVGLHAILNDDHKRQYFKIFALKEFNAENIMFWEEVVSFKKLFIELKEFNDEVTHSDENRHRVSKLALLIANKYLLDDYSIYNINTSNTLKQQVASFISNPHYFYKDDCKFLFDDIVLEIMTTVLPDMYHRFLVSNEYKEMLKSVKHLSRGRRK